MNQELPTKNFNKLCMDSKMLWLLIGTAIFAFIAFVLPVPESLKKVVQEYGFADNMIKTGVASSISQAAWKAKLILGIIPMATIFFTTKALPIGIVGFLFIYKIIGFPPGITEPTKAVLEATRNGVVLP